VTLKKTNDKATRRETRRRGLAARNRKHMTKTVLRGRVKPQPYQIGHRAGQAERRNSTNKVHNIMPSIKEVSPERRKGKTGKKTIRNFGEMN